MQRLSTTARSAAVLSHISPVDFTSVLPKPANMYAFNPTMAYIGNNLYLCAFRGFVRYPKLFQKGDRYDYTEDIFTDPNHPWLGGAQANTWWRKDHGEDNTRLCILSISNGLVTLHKDFSMGDMRYLNGSVVKDGKLRGNDARMLRIHNSPNGSSQFVLTYNTYLTDKNVSLRDGKSCGNDYGWCTLIGSRLLVLDDDLNLQVGDESLVCPEMSNQVEKNWSFWTLGKQTYFSYGLYPDHTIISVDISPHGISCGQHLTESSAMFFHKLQKYYNGNVHISVTTPALRIGKEFVGVGHIKFRHDTDVLYPVDSWLFKFMKEMKASNKTFHPQYVYLMYFYSFSSKDGTLTRVSAMFLPPSDVALCFPSGFCKTDKKNVYSVQYGDGDAACAFFTITRNQLKSLLIPAEHLKPSHVPFLMASNPLDA